MTTVVDVFVLDTDGAAGTDLVRPAGHATVGRSPTGARGYTDAIPGGASRVGPRLLALLLCHSVTQDDDGRPVLNGLYDRVVLRSVPGVDECETRERPG